MPRRNVVHIVYLDDSRKDKHIQIMCAVIIPDQKFDFIEQHFGYTIADSVPEAMREDFEFHASDMLHRNPPFDNFLREQALTIMERGVESLGGLSLPSIAYSVVDLVKLSNGLYGRANPIDVAFRACLLVVEDWFKQYAPNELGIFISDDFSDAAIKRVMRIAFRDFRPKVRSSPLSRGFLSHALDDIYFGQSKESVGIQLADICALVIRRHVAGGYADTEDLYRKLERHIFRGVHAPSSDECADGPRRSAIIAP
jgi:hypothetical protein